MAKAQNTTPTTSTEIIPFQYQSSKEVRTVKMEDGSIWFVAKDVAEILGYKDTVNAVKQHCRGVVKHHPIVDSLGRSQKARIINEPDLYRMIAHCELEEGVKFEAWIFEEVLPQIHQTGSYTPTTGTLTPEQQRKVQAAVSERVHAMAHGKKPANELYKEVYRSIKDHFDVASYKDISQGRFDELIIFVNKGVAIHDPLEADINPASFPAGTLKEKTIREMLERIDGLYWRVREIISESSAIGTTARRLSKDLWLVKSQMGQVFPEYHEEDFPMIRKQTADNNITRVLNS